MLRLALAAFLALFIGADKSNAHEFWISPEAYRAAVGDAVLADLRVGEEFRGSAQSYVPRNFTRFEVITPGAVLPVEGRIGDLPALNAEDLPEGLAVVVHETTVRDLTWDEWDRFAAFAEHKGLGDVATMQEERGLDRIDVREDYFRYAKSLIAIGHGHGQDGVVGLRTELVALANPYTDDLAGALPVQLWLESRHGQVHQAHRRRGARPMPLINVDTDMIIPKQFLKTIKRTGLGKNLFDEMRYDDDGNEIADFVLNQPAYRDAQILVAGDNFGCGSSREHAPWALLDFGIRCVIAPASPTSSSTTASRTASCPSSCRRKTSTS
jgi:hypothetical protein